MSEQRHSTAIAPGATSVMRNPLLLQQLKEKRDEATEIVTEEMKKDPPDYGIVNPMQELATLYHDAILALERLLSQNAHLGEALKNRILVALAEAKQPAWEATHRHYKGKLYRVTGVRWNADHDEDLLEEVEYDDEEGTKYTLSRRRWESVLTSGKPRYEFIGLTKKEDGT